MHASIKAKNKKTSESLNEIRMVNCDIVFGPASARSYKIGVVGNNSWTSISGPASVRSYKISVVGNSCLVGNAVFSETALMIFLIFCIKLGDYNGRKVTELDFFKKYLIWRYSQKSLQISPKSDTLIFGCLVGW